MLDFDDFTAKRGAVGRGAIARRAERLGKMVGGHEFDDEHMAPIDGDRSAPPLAFHIIYADTKQNLTGRCITLRNLQEELEEVRVTAYCHLRHALRSFIASRIVETTDLATGEVHEDGLAYFSSHPLLRHTTADVLASRSGEILAVHECRDEIIILNFVGASDGHFDDDELDEVVKHVLNRCPEEGLSEGEIRRRVRSFVPDEYSFSRALDRICRGSGDARALVRSLRRVVDADGELDPEEVAFTIEIENRLGAAGRL